MNQPCILVTGGTGFVGSHLIELLHKTGFTNIHTTSFSGKAKFVENIIGADRIHQLDLTDLSATKNLIKTIQPEQVYHLASFALVGESFKMMDKILSNNIKLQSNLLVALKEFAPKARLLHVGSAEEYGVSVDESEIPYTEDHSFRPINPYAVSKIAQDMLAYSFHMSYGLDLVRVRPFNHIGERQTTAFAIPAFTRQIVAIENNEQDALRVGNLSAIRDFTDVKDMVKAYLLVMSQGKTGEVYNIGSGQGIKMDEILKKLISLSSVEVKIEVDETRFRPHDIPEMVAGTKKITALGWKPEHKLDETLDRIIKWYRIN